MAEGDTLTLGISRFAVDALTDVTYVQMKKVEIDGSRVVLRKDVDDAISRLRGRFKLDGFADTDDYWRRASAKPVLADIRVPTLLIGGEFDRVAAPAVMKLMAQAIPSARYVEMAGIGHLMNLEAPDEFDRLLLDFLREPLPGHAAVPVADTLKRANEHVRSVSAKDIAEHAVIGNIVPDFPLINKSFNLSYAGNDL